MIDKETVKRKFEGIGARVKFAPGRSFTVDVGHDRRGEHFVVGMSPEAEASHELSVPDLRGDRRHLLLFVRDAEGRLSRLLCGHDERQWFVAATPGGSNVASAMEALKPEAARVAQARAGVKTRDRHRRRNAGFLRQGEWFFIPVPEVSAEHEVVHRDEPLRRDWRSKPHMVEELFRHEATTVYVHARYPEGLTEAERKAVLRRHPELAKDRWEPMWRTPEAFVRGRVTHPDHATLVLDGWHRVVLSQEHGSGLVSFLD